MTQRLIFGFIILIISLPCYAGDLDGYSLVKLNYGINQIDFNNDGSHDLVVFSHRENYNAHSADIITLYVYEKINKDIPSLLNIVPILKESKEDKYIFVSGGADCLLNDFRLLRPDSGHETMLIIASRDIRKSYSEENRVHFDYYRLKYNSDEVSGFPYAYFDYFKTVNSKKAYCDVNKAFKGELGLGNYMKRSD